MLVVGLVSIKYLSILGECIAYYVFGITKFPTLLLQSGMTRKGGEPFLELGTRECSVYLQYAKRIYIGSLEHYVADGI